MHVPFLDTSAHGGQALHRLLSPAATRFGMQPELRRPAVFQAVSDGCLIASVLRCRLRRRWICRACVKAEKAELREDSLRKFRLLPKRWSKTTGDEPQTSRPLGASQARRMLLFENAAALGDEEWLQALLQAGVDVNGRNLFGQTALFLSSWYGHESAVAALISHGAEALPAAGGVTPKQVAEAMNHHGVVEMLCNHFTASAGDAEASVADYFKASAHSKAAPQLLLPEPDMVGSWLFLESFPDDFLHMLDNLGHSLPVPETEMGRRAAERLFFCDAIGCIQEALTSLLRSAGFGDVHVSPWLRFLRYKSPNVPLVPHVDYQWLPGYISASLPGYSPAGLSTTHTLLLYLTDCQDGGETWLLEEASEVSDTPEALARVPARRGRVLLFPHERLHMGTALRRLPKMMLRADVRLGSAPRAFENTVGCACVYLGMNSSSSPNAVRC